MKRVILMVCVLLPAVLLAVQEHPRLIADVKDFAALKVRLGQTELGRLCQTRLLDEAEALLDFKPLKYEKDVSGRRILHVSRAAVNLIGKSAMAYRLTDDKRFARRAIDEALTVSAFSDWNPSHFLDTAEMTLAVALAYDWLYDELTEAQRKTLCEAICRKGLAESDGSLRTGWWVNASNNWCQVCHGGLVAGAVAVADREPALARRVVDRAVKCLPNAMAVFAPDGGFPEGPAAYWPYALEYNALAIWAIEKFDGTDHGLCALPGFTAEVEYLDACTGPTGASFNFSDAGAYSLVTRGATFPQWWLAKRFRRPDTLVFHELVALRRMLAASVGHGRTARSYDRFFPFLLLCLTEPAPETKVASPLARVIDGENPIAVMRTSWTDREGWYVGLKGGTPSANHGHLDVGSFVLDAAGCRWVSELGCENYASVEASEEVGQQLWNKGQDSPRWTLFRYATEGHGTLQFGDEQQVVRGMARFSPLKTSDVGTTTELDLSTIYARNVRRTFALGKTGGFTVADSISGARPGETVAWRVNTFAAVEACGNVATLTMTDRDGKTRRLRMTASPADVVFKQVDCSRRRRPFEADNPGLTQLTFALTVPASGALAFSVSFEAAAEPEDELAARLPAIFAKAAAHYRALDAAATPLRKDAKGGLRTPHGFDRATGKPDMRSIYWWTAGHFPGSLWYLYEATGDVFFRERATDWTEILAPNAKVTDNHDVGFIMYCSYGNARRILKTTKYDGLLRETAESLCKRYNEKLGLIRSWGALDDKAGFLVIPDNLMNLELLEWAAGESKKEKGKSKKEKGKSKKGEGIDFDEIATSHADVTMSHHFRPDGGCYHVLDYDQETKRVKGIMRGQGASCETAWSRGQSWAIYGYTMMYRMMRNERYLDFARKVADYAIGHPNMPADGVPYWDYGAPGEERDSSAGAIMASALLELSQYVDAAKRERYRGFAVKQLLALSSSVYFSEGDEIGHFLLKHGTGHKPARSEVDTPLDYGDYYFLEALLRFRNLKERKN